MIDISDGLSSELRHLCQASHVGCKIEAQQIPIAEDTRRWTEMQGISPVLFVMESGEEYELLMALRPKQYEVLRSSGRKNTIPLFNIGRICDAKSGLRLLDHEKETKIEVRGWDHFNQ